MAKSTAANRLRTSEEDKEGRRPMDTRSETGRKKAAITLRSYHVAHTKLKKIKGKPEPVNYEPAEIHNVPGPAAAIREYVLLRGIKGQSNYTFRTVELPNTEKDAGDVGYRSTHRQPRPKQADPETADEASDFEPVLARDPAE